MLESLKEFQMTSNDLSIVVGGKDGRTSGRELPTGEKSCWDCVTGDTTWDCMDGTTQPDCDC